MLWALTGEASVLFPFGLLERLSPEARRTLLLHELAHLRRGDHWVRLVEAAVTALYWWHPVVWWARREIRIAEEACCDGWVLSEMPDRRETYASALVEAACFSSESPAGLPVAASGLGSFASVKRRVTMIMLGDDPEKLSPVGRFALIAAALLCLMLLPTRAGMEDGPRQPPSGVMAAADVSFQRFDPQVELQAFEASARQARGR
jgi:beta-lactamase regulating signal transducer with metallopeptidase domain